MRAAFDEPEALPPAMLRRGPLAAVGRALEAQRGRWFLWFPVGLSAGAGIYLSLLDEPSALSVAAVLAAAVVALAATARTRLCGFALLAVSVATGAALAKLRVELLDGPIIERRTATVDVEGWVEEASALRSGQRIVLRVVAIAGWNEDSLPRKVRLNVYGGSGALAAGDAVRVRTRLEPVPGPVEPGGFDFARRAWFDGIGGAGQVFGDVTPMDEAAAPPPDIALHAWLERVRRAIAERVVSALPGQEGAFVTAVTTGRRGGLDDTVVDDLRGSGLAHLLAISGLHMVLVAGTAFWLVRACLALVPALALRFAIKKWAASVALAAAFFYLALSGASISTQRAFIMIAIMFAAVLVDRPAISIRNVALAALAILVVRPESAVDVSFQMSFLTVCVLIAFFEWRLAARDDRAGRYRGPGRVRAIARTATTYTGGVVATTVLAGFATAPVAAYHFNTLASYGVLGNLVAVPLMGFVVMPFAFIGVLAVPVGLDGPFFLVSGAAVSAILDTAAWVTALPGAVQTVAAQPAAASLATVAGLLFVCLWQGRGRWLGAAAIAIGIGASGLSPRPLVLIDRDAKLAAIRNEDGALVPTSARAGRFAAERWLRADGDAATIAEAADRSGLVCDDRGCVAAAEGGLEVAWLSSAEALWDECRRADIMIARFPLGAGCAGPRLVIDWWDIYDGGAHAVFVTQGGLVVERAHEARGRRPWVPQRAQEDDSEVNDSNHEDAAPLQPDASTRQDPGAASNRLADALERAAYALQDFGNRLLRFLR